MCHAMLVLYLSFGPLSQVTLFFKQSECSCVNHKDVHHILSIILNLVYVFSECRNDISV